MSEAERWLDIEMDNGVVDMEKRRSAGAGRRESDVGSDDLRALIQAEGDRSADARRLFEKQIDELKAEVKENKEKHDAEIDRIRNGYQSLVKWVASVAGGAAVMIYVLNWIGPTVVRRLIDSIAGTGP